MSRAWWQVGRVVPGVLVLVCASDVALRFASIDPLTFRAWEALSRFRQPGAPFEPNRQYYRRQSYGDAASMGNLPDGRDYHAEQFTTDARGFRNLPAALGASPSVLVTGDSFAVGSGVSDDETLSAVVSRSTGRSVYNAGGIDADPDRLVPLARQLTMRHGVVLSVYSEDRELPVVPTGRKRAVNRLLSRAAAIAGPVMGRIRGLMDTSPLRIVSQQAIKHLENDRILPNSHRAAIVSARLLNGDEMLFPADRVRLVRGPREASPTYWRWLQQALRADDLSLLVVLVPSKYTVYRPLFDAPRPDDASGEFLNELERQLRDSDVPVVNLTRGMSVGAERSAGRHEYLYYRDDIHWNPRGTEIAARIVCSYLQHAN